MAVLVLLALLGLGMMIATRGERQKLTGQRETFALDAVMDRAILLVRERLRDDLLGDPNVVRDPVRLAAVREDPTRLKDPNWFDPNLLLGGDPNDPNFEGEPFDAPSPKDRWLASTIPWPRAWETMYAQHGAWVPPILDGLTDPNYKTLDALLDDPNLVYVWPRVTFLGDDPNALGLRRWDGKLGDDPSPADPNSALSNRLTAEGAVHPLVGFDPNRMLLDADGDGIPDSPVSFIFPIDTPAPTDRPKQVYVAIRIVDNCSKLNVNTAGINNPAVERRGRYTNDILLDPSAYRLPILDLRRLTATVDPSDAMRAFRVAQIQKHFPTLDPIATVVDPNLFNQVVRGRLFNGAIPGFHTAAVETSLTRRNCLIPYDELFSELEDLLLPDSLLPRQGDSIEARRLQKPRDLPFYYMIPKIGYAHGLFRRSLLTTRSFDVLRRPPLVYDPLTPVTSYRINGSATNSALIGSFFADALARVIGYEKLDLNYVNPTNPEDPNGYLRALGNIFYAGNIVSSMDPVAGTSLPVRVRNAWQLALNVVDYRDPDDEPTFLTLATDPTKVLIAGVEQQPFITEAYARLTTDDEGELTEEFYAVELYVPDGWGVPTDKLALNTIPIGTGGFGVTPRLEGAAGGTYYVFVNQTGCLDFPPGTYSNTSFRITGTGGVVLTYDPDGPGPVARYPIDAIANPSFDVQKPGNEQTAVWSILRNTSRWRWTVGYHTVSASTKASSAPPVKGTDYQSWLGLPNTTGAPADTDVYPCPWWFRNAKWTEDPLDPMDPNRWHFDSPGDLSRVLAVGNGLLKATDSASDPNQTVTYRLRNAQEDYKLAIYTAVPRDPNDFVGVGRLDTMRYDPNEPEEAISDKDPRGNPTRVFDYFTTIAAGSDALDNDGDGNIDEAVPADPAVGLESEDIGYRVPGRINVNTAPEYVLRSIPFFYDDRGKYPPTDPNAGDPAAGIVTLREGRPVVSPFVSPGSLTQPPPGHRIRWFRSVGEIALVRSSNPDLKDVPDKCKLDHFGVDPNDLLGPPDYDALDDPNVGKGLAHDVRQRDILLARAGNLLTVRSDTYTVYIALIDSQLDSNGNIRYLRRCQFTLDRGNCLRNPFELPYIISRVDTNYYDDTR